jgi:hypothetical protein
VVIEGVGNHLIICRVGPRDGVLVNNRQGLMLDLASVSSKAGLSCGRAVPLLIAPVDRNS